MTSEQALTALHNTVVELDRAMAGNPRWGTDERGRPNALAVQGLINRRFADRLIDQVRRTPNTEVQRLSAPLPTKTGEALLLEEVLSGPSAVAASEDRMWLQEILEHESAATKAAVVSRGLGLPELAGGASSAAVRQRISRFARKHRTDLLDAA